MKKLVPLILAILGLMVGTGAGIFLQPVSVEIPPETAEGSNELKPEPQEKEPKKEVGSDAGFEYVKLNNQFIVPVVNGKKVAALVVMSLSVEVSVGQKETVYIREPKLRDAFLQVLFVHANSGGFDGVFTSGEKMDDLRGSLIEAAVSVLGSAATSVLIIDIVRQDV